MILSVILIISGLTGFVGINLPGLESDDQLPDQSPDRRILHEDDGSGLSFDEDKPRIDRFAEELRRNKSAIGYIIAYGGLMSYKNEAAIRLRCIRNHLRTAHGIPASRLKLIEGGYRVEVSVRLYLVQRDDSKPTPYATVSREAVQMRKVPKYPCGKPASSSQGSAQRNY
jgi:hypothetical protein